MAFLYQQTVARVGAKITQSNRTPAAYHKHPERTAWFILLGAFITLCTLMLTVWGSGRSYLINAKNHFTTIVTSINGTVLAKPTSTESPLPILSSQQLEVDEFTIISTDDTSQAALTFFDDSALTLYSNTTLIIHQSNQPRFRFSPLSEQIEVELVKGRIRAAPADTQARRTFTIRSPHARIGLTQGSYAVEVNNEQTQVVTRLGSAEVTAQNKTIPLQSDQLSLIAQGQPPSEPIPAEQNLLVNSDFSQGLANTWTTDIFIPENAAGVVTATLEVNTVGNRPVLEFFSEGADNIHTEAAVEQVINKDVQDFQSLRINADVLLNDQSLPGGGFIGTEFPIRLKLSYKDADGNDRDWYHGFYYQPPPDNYILYDQLDNANENISQGLWYPYESENLLETLGDIKPVYVKSIRLYASGWIYNAMVADVKLLAKE